MSDIEERKLTGGEKRSKEAKFKKLKKHKGDFVDRYGKDAESVMHESDCTLIDYDAVTLNTYPAVTHEYICKLEQSGIQIEAANKTWTIFYEDKMIILQGSSARSGPEFEQLKKLFTMVSITAYFPEQFN